MVKTQVLTVDHEGKYSLPLPRPDLSVAHLMATRTGKLRRGSPAKQPWALHTHEGNSDLPAQTILASHTCVFLVLPLFNLTYKICCTCLCQLHRVHTVDPTCISANLPCTGSCCWGLPLQLGDRCFCLCTCALTWHWSQCAEGYFYNMKRFVVEPLFPGVGYNTVSSDGAETKHQKAVPFFVLTSSATHSSAKEALDFNFPQRHIFWFLPGPQDQIIFCSFVSQILPSFLGFFLSYISNMH